MPELSTQETELNGVFKDEQGRLILKIAQDDAAEIIERLRETHVDSHGRAYLLRLDLLAERMGARWAFKRDLVFDHLKVTFERRFHEPDWCIRVDDDSFLMCIPTLGEHKGALSAAELWYAAGQFFVGDVSQVRAPLYEAIACDVDRLRMVPIDLNKYFDRAEARPFREPSLAPIATAPEADRAAPIASAAMTAIRRQPVGSAVMVSGGRSLRVASAIEPVFEMKKLTLIGHRFEPAVTESVSNVALDGRAIGQMEWADREQVDIANIEQGVKLLQMRSPEQRKLVMIVPAAFSSFASPRVRARITATVAAAAQAMGLKVLFEMRNLTGVPQGRLVEVAALLRPYCMTVMGHVGADQKAISTLKGSGLAGVCIDYDGARRDDSALEVYLQPLTTSARAATGACMVHGFSSLHQVAVARLAGATHASVRSTGMIASRP